MNQVSDKSVKMFQNMLVTGLSPLSDIRNEVDLWENKPFTTIWPEREMHQMPKEIKRTIKKKNKRVRTAFTTNQLRALETTFTTFKYIDSERRRELAETLNISEKTIKVWFQNRRMKEKRESESSCDSSSDALNTTPPPNCSPDVESSLCPGNVANDGVTTPTVEYNHLHAYDQSYQSTDYQNQAYQMPPLINSAFVYDTNAYPTQYYPNYNGHYEYNGHYSNGHHFNQNYNEHKHEQGYENWAENFELGY